jgi:ABC-type transporter Mla subunit MlaD
MDIERLISEAPLLGAVVFTVSLFIRYLGKRDEELRHIVELFNERVASLEKTQQKSTETTAVLRETVSNLDTTMRETKTLILASSRAQDRQAREQP